MTSAPATAVNHAWSPCGAPSANAAAQDGVGRQGLEPSELPGDERGHQAEDNGPDAELAGQFQGEREDGDERQHQIADEISSAAGC